jgi:tRNA-specific 2-thiouridylase
MRLAARDLSRAGVVERASGDGAAGGTDCGDRVRITLRVDDGRVEEARFAVHGCPAATAAAAWCAEQAEGARLLDAATLSLERCLAERQIDAARSECAAVALDALHAAIADALTCAAVPTQTGRTAVAMSGGVDSAVALRRIVAAGREAVGLTLRLWIDPEGPDVERACCSPDAVRRARATCHALGVPHVTLDGRNAFRRAVVEPFVEGYAAGETPNPCTTCNGAYRIAALLAAADTLGASTLATGHYATRAQVVGQTLVARGADPAKDQSYMLASVPPALVERLEFPLGNARKDDVRREALEAGLQAATVRESQDVCFLGGGDVRSFLAREGVRIEPGPIEDERGEPIGTHAGAAALTPGQRRGLGVSGPEPLYVLRTDVARNAVVVGPRAHLARREVQLRGAVLHAEAGEVEAKLRARSPAVAARVRTQGGGRLALELAEPAYGVAAGQTAVLYDAAGAVVGCGTIDA